MVLTILLLVTMASALAVVYARHETRRTFVALQQAEKQRDEMNIEWGRLALEQSTWATHVRIDKLAREKLGMKVPGTENIVIIKP
jgi:cell division protein FtsL